MNVIDPERVECARKVLDRVRADWLARPGVTGLDIGLRQKGDRLTDEVAIRIYVLAKLPLDALDQRQRFPSREGGVPVDVIEYDPRAAEPVAD